jgi:adenylate kinase family enzyme
MARLHIMAASGAGTTTLGSMLAERLGLVHVDPDSIFWMATDPPFTTRRTADERLAMLHRLLPVTGQWVFSGSASSWATSLEPFYDLIVFLRLDPAVRMRRLRQREAMRYGPRIDAGGDMAATSAEFLAWANAYDTAGLEQRSLRAHEAWLASQTAPVLRLDSSAPSENLLATVLATLAAAA